MLPLAHNMELLYPAIARINQHLKKPIELRSIDTSVKLKGWQQLGQRVSRELSTLTPSSAGSEPFVLCEDYMQTAEMAFYLPRHPLTFCLGSYITDGGGPKRRTQYDLWPDRSLSQDHLKGRDALYVGYMHDDLTKAFERIERLPDEDIVRSGLKVRRFVLWRCHNFRGLTLPPGGQSF
jgi:hypothetical protein